jgi:hypothetical protein
MRARKKREYFGRLSVLGGFALVTPSRASDGDTDEVNARLKREQEPKKKAVVQDVGQESLNGTMGSRREED